MSIFDCIENAIAFRDDDGKPLIDVERGRQAQALYNELRDKYLQGMDRNAAEAAAAADVKRITKERTALKRHRVSQQLRSNHYLKTTLENHVDPSGNVNAGDGLKRLMERINFSTQAISRMHYRRLNDFIGKHSKDILGRTRDKANMDRVTRELLGESTGDAVSAAMARSMREVFDDLRRTFNAHGGNIGKLENWIPQRWNDAELRKITPEKFADDMIDKLDWDKIHNPLTEKPFGANNPSRQFLIEAYKGLTGLRKEKLSNNTFKASSASRYDEHRILHFKDADSWLSIADKYGNPNLFDAAIGYIDLMSRDVALMKHLGPSYNGGFAFSERVVENWAKDQPDPHNALKKAKRDIQLSSFALGSIDGSLTTPKSELMANAFGGVRNMLAAAQLASAALTSMGDYGAGAIAARHLGMSESSLLKRQISALAGKGKQEAERIVGVADTASETSAAMVRWVGDVSGPEITRRVASGVFRVSGLSRLTDANRLAFQMELMGYLFEDRDIPFSDLHPGLQGAMRQADISAADWNIIRTTEGTEADKGGLFLVPDEIRRREDLKESARDSLSIKLQAMIEQQTNFAVPTRDLIADSFIKGKAQPGTFSGEITKGILQYKGFSITHLMNTIRRAHSLDGNWNRMKFVATVVTTATVFGAISMTAKDVSKGQTPRDPSDPAFWGAAFMQGGGLGILGDFLFQDYNRYGGSLGATIAGPQFGFLDRVARLTFGNIDELRKGEDTDLGEETAKFVKDFMPGGNLWYSRLVMERMVFDQLQKITDPQAYEAFRRREKAADERNQEYFWSPGELLPEF